MTLWCPFSQFELDGDRPLQQQSPDLMIALGSGNVVLCNSKMAVNRLKVVIFTSVPPRQVAQIMARIRRDAAEAQVMGVLADGSP